MANKQIRQLIESPTQVLVADGVDPESNLGYYGLSSIGKALLGITTASQGQEALSLVPGTHVQAYDADLAAIAALNIANLGVLDRTGDGTVVTRTTGTTGLNVLAAANEAAARSAIGAMSNTAPEIITNANGTAYRWPNGMQICTHTGQPLSTTFMLASPIHISTDIPTWTFPAAFNASPMALCQPGDNRRWAGTTITPGNNASCTYRQLAPYHDTALQNSYLFAIGTYTP